MVDIKSIVDFFKNTLNPVYVLTSISRFILINKYISKKYTNTFSAQCDLQENRR